MNRKSVGVLFGFHPQPWHAPFLDRLRSHHGVDARYAHGDWGEHLQSLADDLVAHGPDVVVTMDTPCMKAAAKATSTIPTVSLVCRPTPDMRSEFNLTGLASKEIDARAQLRILLSILEANGREPSAVSVLFNADNPAMEPHVEEIEREGAEHTPPLVVHRLPVRGPDYSLTATLEQNGDAQAIVVLEEPIVVYKCAEIGEFLTSRPLPTICESPTIVEHGALACYGPDRLAMYDRIAAYVEEIIKNDLRPGHLPPVEEAPSLLFVNMAVAKSLGISAIPELLDGVRWEPWTAMS